MAPVMDQGELIQPSNVSGSSQTRSEYYAQKRAERQQAFVEEMEALRIEEGAGEHEGPPAQPAVQRVQESSKQVTSNGGPSAKPAKVGMKDLSKAERRAIQERQRAEKAASKGSSAPISGPASAATAVPSKIGGKAPNGPATAAGLESNSSAPLELFLHLERPPTLSVAQRTNPVIHHSILRLAHLYSHFKIVGSNARCVAMLDAFKDVIRSYTPPPGTSLSRHLPSYLSPQISHLVHARPLSVSMGNAIRHLKGVIGRLGVDMSDDQAKKELYERIDRFVRDRIVVADRVIESYAVQKIKQGDVIMTYANSSVVQGVLLEAHRQGIEFRVIVVDARPMYEGKNLLRLLSRSGIRCSYVLLSAIGAVLKTVNMALLGTHALLGNGAMYGRAGTAMVAMMCKQDRVPVVVCCETYKFSERVMLDSIVSNEMSTPDTHLPPTSHYAPFDFPSVVPQPGRVGDVQELAVLYDVSRPEDVTMVITEAGMIPVQSVPVLLRDYKPLLGDS
ncbi:hypothetical protein CROQUDRAFT_652144 [Cronartium quercuum f. sp. fusiforme G11]|uniref:Translation initiation factor eIF2B subunit delta n=1 Tax=Cronartium quercuum f. sp. fusiforme G11 TaxID=708437 RepID=A0A9P6TFM2_9BASI|nr:hypothetical protein CROQUDRAFT_652144 [Cronartium quercuum f. sp. fusiforme G11]